MVEWVVGGVGVGGSWRLGITGDEWRVVVVVLLGAKREEVMGGLVG